VISRTRRKLTVRIEEINARQKSKLLPMSSVAFLYKRTSEEIRKGNLLTPNNVALFKIRIQPWNHSSHSNIASEYFIIILHTTNSMRIKLTTPHHPTLHHLKPFPFDHRSYHHHCATILHYFGISQRPYLSVTPMPSAPPIITPAGDCITAAKFKVPQEHHLLAMASQDIVDGILLLPAIYPRTSLVPTLTNHNLSII